MSIGTKVKYLGAAVVSSFLVTYIIFFSKSYYNSSYPGEAHITILKNITKSSKLILIQSAPYKNFTEITFRKFNRSSFQLKSSKKIVREKSVFDIAADLISKLLQLPQTLVPTCKSLRSPSRNVKNLQHCWSGYNGYFLVNISAKNPSIRGRIVGAAIQELQIHKLTQESYGLFYFLPYGLYRAHIRLEFLNFDPNNFMYTTPINEEILHSYQFLNPGMCPFGVSRIPGYWLTPDEKAASRLVAPWQRGAQPELTLALNDLEYIPRDCGLISRINALKCTKGISPWKSPLQVCLFGDSQMRHLYNTLETLMYPTEYFKYKNSETDKIIHKSSFLKFYVDDWGNCFREGDCPYNIFNLTCTIILLNFGHWQAGYPQGYPRSPQEYSETVFEALTNANEVLSSTTTAIPKKLIWLTNHPFGEMPAIYKSPPEDWRSHTVLNDYNKRAVEVCQNLSVDYIDIYNIASSVNDMTYDGKHYKLPVEREIGKLVFHELCSISGVIT